MPGVTEVHTLTQVESLASYNVKKVWCGKTHTIVLVVGNVHQPLSLVKLSARAVCRYNWLLTFTFDLTLTLTVTLLLTLTLACTLIVSQPHSYSYSTHTETFTLPAGLFQSMVKYLFLLK